jgi:hypothetical protein
VIEAKDFVTLITQQLNSPQFRQAADASARTLEVQAAKLSAGRAALLGTATQSAYDAALAGMEGVNQALRSPMAQQVAAFTSAVISPFSKLLQTAIDAMQHGDLLGGAVKAGESISEGLKAGIAQGAGAVYDEANDLAAAFISTIKSSSGFDINSPAKKMIPVGVSVAEGLSVGIKQGLLATVLPDLQDTITDILQQARQMATAGQRRSIGGLERLNKREPDFLAKLIEGAKARGINPDWLLNVMATETAGTFNPAITNPLGYTGLIQFGGAAAKDVGTTTGALRGMSAVQQLVYVFKYLDLKMKQYGAIDSEAKLYAAVGAGNYSTDDQAVKFRQGQRAYALNRNVWDVNRDGQIQQWEFGPAARSHLGAGQIFSIGDAFDKLATSSLPPFTAALQTATDALHTLVNGVRAQDNSARDGGSMITGANFGTVQVNARDSDQAFGLVSTTSALAQINTETLLWKHELHEIPAATSAIEEATDKIRKKYTGVRGELLEMGFNAKNLSEVFQQSFTSAFTQIDQGFKGMLEGFTLSFLKALDEMATAAVAKKLGELIFGDANGARGARVR